MNSIRCGPMNKIGISWLQKWGRSSPTSSGLAQSTSHNNAGADRLNTDRSAPKRPLRILILFGKDWDREALQRFGTDSEQPYLFYFEGFELFSFPSNARLLTFDIWRFVERMRQRYAGKIDGVVSNNEQFGSLSAALLAEQLGLPGLSARCTLTCQHKYLARLQIAAALPEVVPQFAIFPYTWRPEDALPLPLPFFVKPVKATFSVLARSIEKPAALHQLLEFAPWETILIKRLVRPFNQAIRRLLPEVEADAHHMIAESSLVGAQLNIDGYVRDGQVTLFGIVDEIMYPDTHAFLRFAYPSRWQQQLAQRVQQLSEQVLAQLDYQHGCFNLEFFYEAASDSLKLIEVNPRMSTQTADFYRLVDGVDAYAINFALATRQPLPAASSTKPVFGAAASFVFRKFDGTSCNQPPTAAQRAWLAQTYPDARLMWYGKTGRGLRREYKWLGSHRYAILNLAGIDAADLQRRLAHVCGYLGWQCDQGLVA
jgi:hypothetical protein